MSSPSVRLRLACLILVAREEAGEFEIVVNPDESEAG